MRLDVLFECFVPDEASKLEDIGSDDEMDADRCEGRFGEARRSLKYLLEKLWALAESPVNNRIMRVARYHC